MIANPSRLRKDKTMELCDGQLKLYSSVTATRIDWLWYPYIPFGKITLLQGDPGCGKSTLMMNIIAGVSNGSLSLDGRKPKRPLHVIYQCSEDGAADTIKPRLNAAGADCGNVAFLDEETDWITLGDEKIRRAIADFNAKLLVIDPVQAYLGDADISSMTGMRRMLRQAAVWASLYDCAIVLIGHLNKKVGTKDIYRGLGSIDLIAAARSVLQIEPSEDEADIMVMRQIKSSLAPKGRDQFFIIDRQRCVQWLDREGDEMPDDTRISDAKKSKQDQAAETLQILLASEPAKASDVHELFSRLNIGDRTLISVKKELGIRSVRKDGVWYWALPGNIPQEEQ